MGFPWRNWTILPFLSLPFEIFLLLLLLVHYTYHTLCLLWHVIDDNKRNVTPNKECSLHKECLHLFQRSENLVPVSLEEQFQDLQQHLP